MYVTYRIKNLENRIEIKVVNSNLVRLVDFDLSSAKTPSRIYNASFKNSVT